MELKALLGEAYKDGMTAEEITAALAKISIIPGYVTAAEHDKVKAAMDKAASETAGFKKQLADVNKQLQDRMTEDEKREAVAKADQEKLQKRLAELERDKTVSSHKASFLGLGYAEDIAEKAAAAMADGDAATVFECQKLFAEQVKKNVTGAATGNLMPPPPPTPPKDLTKETFRKMSLMDKQKMATENPEAYKQMVGGE